MSTTPPARPPPAVRVCAAAGRPAPATTRWPGKARCGSSTLRAGSRSAKTTSTLRSNGPRPKAPDADRPDLDEGSITAGHAQDAYGVVIHGHTVDIEASARTREDTQTRGTARAPPWAGADAPAASTPTYPRGIAGSTTKPWCSASSSAPAAPPCSRPRYPSAAWRRYTISSWLSGKLEARSCGRWYGTAGPEPLDGQEADSWLSASRSSQRPRSSKTSISRSPRARMCCAISELAVRASRPRRASIKRS